MVLEIKPKTLLNTGHEVYNLATSPSQQVSLFLTWPLLTKKMLCLIIAHCFSFKHCFYMHTLECIVQCNMSMCSLYWIFLIIFLFHILQLLKFVFYFLLQQEKYGHNIFRYDITLIFSLFFQ